LFNDFLDQWPFLQIAIHSIVSSSKSLIVAMAVNEDAISARQAAEAALVEELYQIEKNGLVQGYHDLFLAKTRAKIAAAALFLRFLDAPKQ
jgi:chaperone required for assembly of F1-ATPase